MINIEMEGLNLGFAADFSGPTELDVEMTERMAVPSGSSDYDDLTNKPKIEGVELIGNKTASALGLAKASDIPSLTGYATETWVNSQGFLKQHQSLANYYTKGEADGRFLTQHQSLANYYTKSEADSTFLKEHQSLAGYATQNWVEGKHYLTEHQSLADYYTKAQADAKFLTQHQSLSAYRTASARDVIDGTKEAASNKVTAISSTSTDAQYPSAKCMYDIIGNIESLLEGLR